MVELTIFRSFFCAIITIGILGIWQEVKCSTKQCPEVCICSLDYKGRFHTFCDKGDMKEIPIDLFDTNAEAITIKGDRNNLTIGPLFARFSKLELLRIIDANVPAIGDKSLTGLISLKCLDLSNNKITTILKDNFRGVEDLVELNLAGNRIERMMSSVFYYLEELRILNLANNKIETFSERQFLNLKKLKKLDLSDNPIRELSTEVFKDIQDLKVLKCRNCQLISVSPQIYNYVIYLTELDLGDNMFEEFDAEDNNFLSLKKLTKLHLDGNALIDISETIFQSQRNLQYLDISRNRIEKISYHAMEKMTNLSYLDLSYNQLNYITFKPLPNMAVLNISGNPWKNLNDIRNLFQFSPKLVELSSADIGYLPNNFLSPFMPLKYLNLSGNNLNSSSLNILNSVRNIELLDLSRNLLNGFGDYHASRVVQIKDIIFDKNPFICDRCHMGPLLDRVGNITWMAYPVCEYPETVRGSTIIEISNDLLEYCIDTVRFTAVNNLNAAGTFSFVLDKGTWSLMIVALALLFLLCVIVIMITFLRCSRHRAQYYTHEDKSDLTSHTSFDIPMPNGQEINFEFPFDDRICTINEMKSLPISPPPKSTSKKNQQTQHNNNINERLYTNNGTNNRNVSFSSDPSSVLPPNVPPKN